jgi:hypothetical protein
MLTMVMPEDQEPLARLLPAPSDTLGVALNVRIGLMPLNGTADRP